MIIRYYKEKFTKNKPKTWAFAILLFFLFLSIFAPFIANERPLFIYYDKKVYFPMLFLYTEKEFGGELETEADYKDPEVQAFIGKKGFSVWPLIPYSYNTVNNTLECSVPAPPSRDNWLGTDDQGRDLLTRLIYGVRFSLFFGMSLMLITTTIGFTVGSIQGYYGGIIDLVTQRITEIWSSLPLFFILMIISSLIEPNFWWLLVTVSFFQWGMLVPIVRAEFLRARKLDYVKAARALGVSNFAIMTRHIIPNIIGAPLSMIPFKLTASITLLTTFDFLGFGLASGAPSLGEILQQARNNLHAPWIAIAGFTTLSLLLGSLIFIGESIRDFFRVQKSTVSESF